MYTVEILVAVDRKMRDFHQGDSLVGYVLKLMSVAADIFADASIGNLMNLAVVDIVDLNDDMKVQSLHSGNINEYK